MQECFVPSCVKIVLMELMHFNYFAIIYPKKIEPSFQQTWIPFTKECCVPILAELLRWFWMMAIFPLLWKWHCAKFGWNCPGGFWEDENVKSLHGRPTKGKPKSSYKLKSFLKHKVCFS